MFFNSCSGCLQVPVPIQYWSPYVAPVKKSSFHMSDILRHHVTNSVPQIYQNVIRSRSDVKYVTSSEQLRRSEFKRQREQECVTDNVKQLRRSSPESDTESARPSKQRDIVRCSLPSALAPLQALCSTSAVSFSDDSSETERRRSEKNSSNSSLKFGINRILSDDFGKEKTEKGNNNNYTESPRQSLSLKIFAVKTNLLL